MNNPATYVTRNRTCRLGVVYFLLFFATFACVQGSDVRKKQMETTRNLGVEYLYQGKYQAALRELLKAERIHAEDPDLQNTLGFAYMEMGKNDLAIKHFNLAIKLKPDYSIAKNNLGVAYSKKKEWDHAIALFEEVSNDLLYNPPQFPLLNLGWAYYNKKNYVLSERYYLEAIKFNPRYGNALHGLGRTYIAMGKIPEAIEKIKTAVGLSPERPIFHFDLAVAYEQSGDFRNALKSYRKVIALIPGTPLAHEATKKLKHFKTK